MEIVIDAAALLAVLLEEPERPALLAAKVTYALFTAHFLMVLGIRNCAGARSA